MNVYTEVIQAFLAHMKRTDLDPRHVEGWMRLVHDGTLDRLSPRRVAREVQNAVDRLDEAGLDQSDELAASYGLMQEAS